MCLLRNLLFIQDSTSEQLCGSGRSSRTTVNSCVWVCMVQVVYRGVKKNNSKDLDGNGLIGFVLR